jgi:CHAT domain-containing protein/ATP/maltotriose-dependent transcriptional regulator MalT
MHARTLARPHDRTPARSPHRPIALLLLGTLLALGARAASEFTSADQAIDAANAHVTQAQGIEEAVNAGNLAALEGQGLATREAALQRASDLRRQAVQIFRAHGQPENASIQLSAIAQNSRALGLLDLALQDLRDAALLDEGMNRTDWIIYDLQDLASLFAERGLRVEQQLALREVVRLAEPRGQRREAAQALETIAGILADLDNWHAAADDLERAVELSRPLGRPEMLSRHLRLLGQAQRHLGQRDAAKRSLDEALAAAPDEATRAEALGELARLATDEGDLQTAVSRWREALALDEKAQAATLRQDWTEFIEVCLQAGENEEAVSVSQRRLEDSRRRFAQTHDSTWRNIVAADLADHGRVQRRAGDPNAARTSLTEALSEHTQIGNRPAQAEDHLALAEAALALAQPNQALTELASVTPALIDDAEIARRAALLRAQALQGLGRYPEADQQLDEALQTCARVGNREGRVEVLQAAAALWREGHNESRLASALSRLGAALTDLGRDEEAKPIYEELMTAYATTRQLREWSTDLTNFANLCERLGDLDRAIALIQQAIEVDTERQDLSWQAVDHGDLARLRAAQGDVQGAIAAARQVLAIGQQMQDPQRQIEGLERVALYQRRAASPEAARQTLTEAETLATSANDLRARSRILSSLAEIAAEAGDWAEVERRAGAALPIDQQLNEPRFLALDQVNLAVALGHQDRTAEALGHCEEALKQVPSSQDSLHIAALVNRGHLRLVSGQGEQGVADFQSVIPVLRDQKMWALAATLLHDTAQWQIAQGEKDLAIESLREAIDLAEKQVVEQPLDANVYLVATVPRSALYDQIISLLNEQNRAVEALEYVSRQDGLELNSQNLLLAAAGNPTLSRAISAESAASNINPHGTTRSEGEAGSEPPAPTPAPAPTPPETIASIPTPPAAQEPAPTGEGNWANVLAGLSATDQAAFELTPLNLPFILRHLPDDQTLFIMYHLGSTCHAYFGALDLPMQGIELEVDRQTVIDQVGEFRRLVRDANDALQDKDRGVMSADDYRVFAGRLEGQANDILAQLYRELVQPLESAIPDYGDYKTILLYPSGVLRLIPFGALVRTKPDGRRAFWVESHDIVYFPCGASEIAQEHMEAPVRRLRGDLLLVAWPGSQAERNYIGNVLQEEQAIGQLWMQSRGDARYHALREGDATRENLLRALNTIDGLQVLHLATHGNLIPGDPEESNIALANHERLRIDDLWSLPLAKTRLTVLSMCDAEYNPEGPADALGTFARAIYIAGCPSVVASLWRVRDDSAQRLMVEFYRNLLTESMSRVHALSEAQRAMIATRGQDPDYSHPFNWGPFVLIGEWR